LAQPLVLSADEGEKKALTACQSKAAADFDVAPSAVIVEHRPKHDGRFVVDFFIHGGTGHGFCTVGNEGKVHKYKVTMGKGAGG
jgi:hypothetical protein